MDSEYPDDKIANNGKAPLLKHTVKDSVFTDLFGNVHYLIQMYRALHPEDTDATEADITNITIKNVLTNSQFNDLGFRLGNRLMVLVEAQSTYAVNIVIRILMYLMHTYNQYFTENNINLYSETKVELPKPELYVVYTGDRKNVPEYITLKDEFFAGEDLSVDVKVKVITDSESDNIISQYIVFTKILGEQVRLYGRTRKAIEEAIMICKDRNVLKEYLESREKEVIDIMTALYDEQEVMDRYVASEKQESEIKATVSTLREVGKNLSETIEFIIPRFGLSPSSAESKVRQYWS